MNNNNALKKKITRGWPPERRKAQAARLRAAKIWTRSTGPKTEKGKAICAANSRRHGFYSRGYRALRKAMALYRQFLKLANQLLNTKRACIKHHITAGNPTPTFTKFGTTTASPASATLQFEMRVPW